MNKIYYFVRKFILVASGVTFAVTCWGMVGVGIARWLFKLEENTAMLCVGLPIFLGFVVFGIKLFPEALRKAAYF